MFSTNNGGYQLGVSVRVSYDGGIPGPSQFRVEILFALPGENAATALAKVILSEFPLAIQDSGTFSEVAATSPEQLPMPQLSPIEDFAHVKAGGYIHDPNEPPGVRTMPQAPNRMWNQLANEAAACRAIRSAR